MEGGGDGQGTLINFELVSHLLIFSQFSRIIKINYRHCSLLPGLERGLVHRSDPAPLFHYSYLGTTWGKWWGLPCLGVSGQGPHFLLGIDLHVPAASWKCWAPRERWEVLASQGALPPAVPVTWVGWGLEWGTGLPTPALSPTHGIQGSGTGGRAWQAGS